MGHILLEVNCLWCGFMRPVVYTPDLLALLCPSCGQVNPLTTGVVDPLALISPIPIRSG